MIDDWDRKDYKSNLMTMEELLYVSTKRRVGVQSKHLNEKELRQITNDFGANDDEKIGFLKDHKDRKKHAALEANINRCHGVIGICVRDNSYYVQAKDQVGEIKEVRVENEWATKKFKPEVLKYVQTEEFINLDSTEISTPIKCYIDSRVVYRIKYCLKKKSWIGLHLKDVGGKGKHKYVETFPITETWIADNYSPEFVETSKNHFLKGQKKIININVGAERQKKKHSNYVTEFMKSVRITWKQKDGERSCMILCVANFFKYMKYNDQANTLQQHSNKKFYETQIILRNIFIESLKELKNLQYKGMINQNGFDVINNSNGMFLVSLVGNDQNNDHCVVLYENLIFDSNEDFALKRTMNNLNYCCSSEKKNVKFLKCFQIAFFNITLKPIRKKNQNTKKIIHILLKRH